MKNYGLTKKNIWNSYYFFPMMISFVFMVITTIAEVFVVINYIEYMWLLFPILAACILFFGGFLFCLIREVTIHNYLVEKGRIVHGFAVSAGTSFVGILMITKYMDEQSGHTYKYTTPTAYVMNPVRLQQFIENYPEIRLIIDPQNPKKGMALVEEYCEKNKMEHKDEVLPELDFFSHWKKK